MKRIILISFIFTISFIFSWTYNFFVNDSLSHALFYALFIFMSLFSLVSFFVLAKEYKVKTLKYASLIILIAILINVLIRLFVNSTDFQTKLQLIYSNFPIAGYPGIILLFIYSLALIFNEKINREFYYLLAIYGLGLIVANPLFALETARFINYVILINAVILCALQALLLRKNTSPRQSL